MRTNARLDEVEWLPPHAIAESAMIVDTVRRFEDVDAKALCVTDENGRIVGVVTPREVRDLIFDRRATIASITNRRAYPVASDFEVEDVAGALEDDPEIVAIPVVESGGQLVGIVRRDDVLRLAGKAPAATRPAAPAPAPAPAPEASSLRLGIGGRNNTTVIAATKFRNTLARFRGAQGGN